MDLNEINRNLQSEFALKKIKVETEATKAVSKANSCKSFAKLVLLEKEIEFMLATEKTNEKTDKAKIKSLETSLKKTRTEKEKLLKKMGLEPSDLIPKYECPICKDSGYIGTNPCECFIKRKNAELIKECGLSGSELVDFEDFDENIFKDKNQKEDTIKLKTLLQNWCNKFPMVSKNKIMLLGETGVGKTFLTKCMAKKLSEKNTSVCFISAYEMNNLMLKYHTTFDSNKLSILIPLTDSDVLFIDDLGTEPLLNNVTINYLFLILSERERFNRPTIITSNFDISVLEERYGERIFSRLSDKQNGFIYQMIGEDIRIKKR